jgi:solute:Na+ symporter, SSS family
MNILDWSIVFGFLIILSLIQIYISRYTKSATDFLAAGRFAGRYLLTIAEGAAGLGAIAVIASFEMHYVAGFSPLWWSWMFTAAQIGIALSGWVIYRFRQTRAMTMAQFFEMRYSKKFRLYAGMIAYISGVLNFAIFPAVGTRFFIYYCHLPETFNLFGIEASTYAVSMALLIGVSVLFTFAGMAAVLVTDFIQGLFTYIVLTASIILLMTRFGWSRISESLLNSPAGSSLINPMDISSIKDFNIWYFIIAVFVMIYGYKSWQGQQGYNCAAKTPHEARMGGILATWRIQFIVLLIAMFPVVAYTFFNHPDFADQAVNVQSSISQIGNEQIREQMRVPIALAHLLPNGFLGFFCVVMLCAFIACNDTYLHSWGTLFIQDIVLPFRKKPLSHHQHLWLLRWSIIGVAVFIFFFSLWFTQTQYILLYFAITAAIYMGGAGACIIGGLYWKRGTTLGAWAALIIGPVLAVAGLIIRTIYKDFPINEQWMTLITATVCVLSYIIISLVAKPNSFNMDKLLHRGKYAVKSDIAAKDEIPISGLKSLIGMTNEFSRIDRFTYIITMSWVIGWSIIFLCVTAYAVIFGISSQNWMTFWKFYTFLGISIGIVFAIWFAIGGMKDIKFMFRKLKTAVKDYTDTGEIFDTPDTNDD